jgi:type I restriction enzyme R subunit
MDPALEEGSQFEAESPFAEPVHVSYQPSLPPEYFDFLFIDECHRSIYSIWRGF